MTQLAKNFDKIATVYRRISSNIYDPAVTASFKQIQHHVTHPENVSSILDLGCGDGSTLKKIKPQFPNATLTGVDISKSMLAEAHTNVTLKTVLSDITRIGDVLPKNDFDLILSHFVLGYIDLITLLNKAAPLLKPHGLISLITNSESSFSGIKQMARQSCSKFKPMKKLIDYIIQKGVKNSKNKIEWETLGPVFAAHNFNLLSLETLDISCEFATATDLFNYIFYGSWGIGELKSYIPLRFYRLFYTTILNQLITFPFHDTARVTIVLLKRTN